MHCLCLKTFALYGSLRYMELHYKDLLLYFCQSLFIRMLNYLSKVINSGIVNYNLYYFPLLQKKLSNHMFSE